MDTTLSSIQYAPIVILFACFCTEAQGSNSLTTMAQQGTDKQTCKGASAIIEPKTQKSLKDLKEMRGLHKKAVLEVVSGTGLGTDQRALASPRTTPSPPSPLLPPCLFEHVFFAL